MKTGLHSCYKFALGLGPASPRSLVGGSISVSTYVPRLADSVRFFVLFSLCCSLSHSISLSLTHA